MIGVGKGQGVGPGGDVFKEEGTVGICGIIKSCALNFHSDSGMDRFTAEKGGSGNGAVLPGFNSNSGRHQISGVQHFDHISLDGKVVHFLGEIPICIDEHGVVTGRDLRNCKDPVGIGHGLVGGTRQAHQDTDVLRHPLQAYSPGQGAPGGNLYNLMRSHCSRSSRCDLGGLFIGCVPRISGCQGVLSFRQINETECTAGIRDGHMRRTIRSPQ